MLARYLPVPGFFTERQTGTSTQALIIDVIHHS